jgi:hypothetical protein
MNCDPSGNITARLNEQMVVMGMVAILACTLEMTYHPIYNMFSLLITTIYESAVVTKDFIDDWADGISKGIKKAKDFVKEIADEIAKAIPKVIAIPKIKKINPDDTIIYRYGKSNPGNLTPKPKDITTGLSFSTIPPLHGKPAVATTIAALNSTGLVVAIKDTATHVSVRPIGGTMQEWINFGSSSIWTMAVKSVVIKWG